MTNKKLAAFTSRFEEFGIDAFLITNSFNIRYLTGFYTLAPHEREAYLLVTRLHAYLFTDGRYIPQKENNSAYVFRLLSPEKGLIAQLQELIKKEKMEAVGFEREDLKWSEYEMLTGRLDIRMMPLDRTVLRIRALKQKGEIEKIKKACELGDGCLGEASRMIRPGMTERSIAWEMEKYIREKGYEFSFDPIVAVDSHSAVPHYDTKSGNGIVRNGSVVLIDMGVDYHGYSSDITRMFFVGSITGEMRRAYEDLREAQEKTIQELEVQDDLRKIDIFCRKDLERKGYGSYPHSTGHGVGLEVHEYPKISGVTMDKKEPGQVVTVEPGIYLKDKWGMRIEDTVAIDKKGKAIALTAFPKTLLVLPS